MSKIALFSAFTLENWNWTTPDTVGIGGSETAHIEQAKRLAKRGHEVVSFIPFGGGDTKAEGVLWKDSDTIAQQIGQLEDYTWFVYRAPQFFDLVLPKGKYYFVAQDIGYDFTPEQLVKIDGYICLCEDHCKYTAARYPELKGRIFKSSNGIKRDLIEKIEKEQIVRNPKKLIYASSPDRGLELLLTDWFRIREFVPDAELHVFYGRNNMHKMMDRGADYLKPLNASLDALKDQPGVHWHGRINQPDLIREMFSAGVWLYPSDWRETSCQPAGSKVLTKKGVKPIENIEVGDMVYTHNGRFRKVTETFSRDYEGDLVSIRARASAKPVYFTPDHLIYTAEINSKNNFKTVWKESEKLTSRKNGTVTAKHKMSETGLKSIKLVDYLSEDFEVVDGMVGRKNSRAHYKWVENEQPLTEEFAYMLGAFCGDGCAPLSRGRHMSVITFAHHAKETDIANRVRNFFGEGCETLTISENEIRTTYYNSVWARFLRNTIGVGRFKRIPEFIWDAPRNVQLAFIEGYYATDGAKTLGRKKSITTVSPSLGYGLLQMLTGCDVLACIMYSVVRDCYTVQWTDTPKHCYYHTSDDYVVYPIQEVGKIPFSGKVYNFEVEEDHSYLVEGMAVHNCIQCMEMQACGVVPVTNRLWAVGENVFHGVMLDGIPQLDNVVRMSLVHETINLLKNPMSDAERQEMMLDSRDSFTWDKFVAQLEKFCI